MNYIIKTKTFLCIDRTTFVTRITLRVSELPVHKQGRFYGKPLIAVVR
jgi:hypothetical protein